MICLPISTVTTCTCQGDHGETQPGTYFCKTFLKAIPTYFYFHFYWYHRIDAGTQVFYDDGTRNAVHVEIRNRALHLGKTLLQALNDGDVRVTVGPREFTFSGQISARGRFRLQHYHLEGLTAVQRNYQRFGTSSNYEFCLNRYPQPCY